MHKLCNMLLGCALKTLGFDLRYLHVTRIQPLANGGVVVVLDPVDDKDYGIGKVPTIPVR